MALNKYIIWSLLGSWLSITSVGAMVEPGPTDTLRRSLTVITDDPVLLNQRKALPLSIGITPLELAKPPISYEQTTLSLPIGYGINPLRTLSSIPHLFPNNAQRGYVSLWLGGLDRSIQTRAGVKLIGRERNYLDTHLSYSSSQYDFTNRLHKEFISPMTSKKKLSDFNWELNYRHLFASDITLTARADYSYHYNNYWALGFAENFHQLTQQNPIPQKDWRYDTQTGVKTSKTSLLLGLLHPQGDSDLLNYDLSLQYQSQILGDNKEGRGTVSLTETNWRLSGFLERILRGNSKIGLKISGELLDYLDGLHPATPTYPDNIAAGENEERGDHDFLINLAPYYRTEGGGASYRWGLRLGIGIAKDYNSKEYPSFFFPEIDLQLQLGKDWLFRGYSTGGVKSRSFSDQWTHMPMLRIGYALAPERVQWDTGVSVQTLIKETLGIKLQGSYQNLQNALSYYPNELWARIPLNIFTFSPINYLPYYDQLEVWNLETEINYTLSKQVELSGAVRYHYYNSTHPASGRPNLEIEAKLGYRPLETLLLTARIQRLQGLEQYDINKKVIKLDPLNKLNLSATYQLSRAWSLSGQAYFFFSPSTSLYWAVPQERFLFQIGANFNF